MEENIANPTSDGADITSLVDKDALIGYTFNGADQKYQCLLCPFYRKNIVQHYKTAHPGKEVLISRLTCDAASIAIEESKILNLNKVKYDQEDEIELENSDSIQGKYYCRFCNFVTKGVDSSAKENFHDHCTNHTGEYKFTCQNCNYETSAKSSIKSHYYKECKKLSPHLSLNEAVIEHAVPKENRVYGYICTKCNFVQMRKVNMDRHLRLWHNKEGTQEVEVLRIDMSLRVKKEEDNETSVKEEKLTAEDTKTKVKKEKMVEQDTELQVEAEIQEKEGKDEVSDDVSIFQILKLYFVGLGFLIIIIYFVQYTVNIKTLSSNYRKLMH